MTKDLTTLRTVAATISLDYPNLLEEMGAISEAGAIDPAWQEDMRQKTLTILRAKRLLDINYPEETALRDLYALIACAYAIALLDPDSPPESFPSGEEVSRLMKKSNLGA